ncbi:rubrerythrin [Orenia metallireducens]|jgi:rubrerythrin|uniref:Rubrerythrin n=1 Tax=Orenia metallireducens TaxID=1413210 RepID=A0A285HRV7_9FIRM|nr:ferritin family protein [Orenia metallireducens]PRX25120.1 rubrerythrin [Orenia metallireducens]SNY38323.1 Rubrerythrin [Orenia metallireducens]
MGVKEESLELAIKMEKESYHYYNNHIEGAENPLSRKVLESLAAQELDHVDKVKKIAANKPIEENDYQPEDIENKVQQLFESFSDSERDNWKESNTNIYRHAMELEQDTYEIYERLAKQTDDDIERKFFEALMQEEEWHYESLQNVFNYFENPGDFYATEESSTWPWMNT